MRYYALRGLPEPVTVLVKDRQVLADFLDRYQLNPLLDEPPVELSYRPRDALLLYVSVSGILFKGHYELGKLLRRVVQPPPASEPPINFGLDNYGPYLDRFPREPEPADRDIRRRSLRSAQARRAG